MEYVSRLFSQSSRCYEYVVMSPREVFLLLGFQFLASFVGRATSARSSSEQCSNFSIVELEEYLEKSNVSDLPSIDEMAGGFKCNVMPFGILKSDWARLALLRDVQPDSSVLKEKLDSLFKLLIVAFYRIEEQVFVTGRLHGGNLARDRQNFVDDRRTVSDRRATSQENVSSTTMKLETLALKSVTSVPSTGAGINRSLENTSAFSEKSTRIDEAIERQTSSKVEGEGEEGEKVRAIEDHVRTAEKNNLLSVDVVDLTNADSAATAKYSVKNELTDGQSSVDSGVGGGDATSAGKRFENSEGPRDVVNSVKSVKSEGESEGISSEAVGRGDMRGRETTSKEYHSILTQDDAIFHSNSGDVVDQRFAKGIDSRKEGNAVIGKNISGTSASNVSLGITRVNNTLGRVKDLANYADPSFNSVHGNVKHEMDVSSKVISRISAAMQPHRNVTSKIKVLEVLREKPLAKKRKYDETNFRNAPLLAFSTASANLKETKNEPTESYTKSRKRDKADNGMENNFPLFYSLGMRDTEQIRNQEGRSRSGITVKC